MNQMAPYEALLRAAQAAEDDVPFWSRLPQLIGAPGCDLSPPSTPGSFQHALRFRIAHRRSPETLALFRLIARLTGARVEFICASTFPQLFDERERRAIIQGLFTELFDGGLAQFRGTDANELRDFLSLRADRAVLQASVAKWALFEVRAAHAARYWDLLSRDAVEELGSDVLSELLSRSLARFRGQNDRQLYVYVRTAAHRTVSRAARRSILDRESLARITLGTPSDAPPLQGRPPRPPALRLRPDAPLAISAEDKTYIEDLLQADGKLSVVAAFRGVTRGSVTKRVQRIMGRLASLEPEQRERVGEWAESTLGELHAQRFSACSHP